MTNILFFSAEWCAPCKVLSKNLEDILLDFPGVTVSKVDIEKDRAFAQTYNIKSVPTLICNGRKLEGAVSRATLREFINHLVN